MCRVSRVACHSREVGHDAREQAERGAQVVRARAVVVRAPHQLAHQLAGQHPRAVRRQERIVYHVSRVACHSREVGHDAREQAERGAQVVRARAVVVRAPHQLAHQLAGRHPRAVRRQERIVYHVSRVACRVSLT
ncbi:unnamed protein product [Euphydryas editha]|uniref:Uncharacterized protein n=1 Tax=Euphydryas editha TaxID=104508 RepID=A0AAU9UKE8_EUPED|nr:unnamed protein product [Euphydryas editha]